MPNIVAIQALRALAALLVAIVHFEIVALMLRGTVGDVPITSHFAAGVDLFFIISGFVMVYSSWQHFGTVGGARLFLLRRIARIVPLYWAVLSLAVIFTRHPLTWEAAVKSFAFVPYRNWQGALTPVYGAGWTLNYEMFFYALFAGALCFPRQVALPALITVLGTIVVVGHLAQPTFVPFFYWSDPIILEFAAGMVLAITYLRGVKLPGFAAIALVVIGTATIACIPVTMPPTGHRAFTWGIAALAIVAGVVLGPSIRAPQWARTAAVHFGDASYSLYLVHGVVGSMTLLAQPRLGIGPEVAAVTGLGVAVLLSLPVFAFFERPATKVVLHTLGKDGKKAALESAAVG